MQLEIRLSAQLGLSSLVFVYFNVPYLPVLSWRLLSMWRRLWTRWIVPFYECTSPACRYFGSETQTCSFSIGCVGVFAWRWLEWVRVVEWWMCVVVCLHEDDWNGLEWSNGCHVGVVCMKIIGMGSSYRMVVMWVLCCVFDKKRELAREVRIEKRPISGCSGGTVSEVQRLCILLQDGIFLHSLLLQFTLFIF